MDLTLYVLTDRVISGRPHEEQAEAAIRGGATAVQLREKALPAGDVVAIGRRIAAICRRFRTVFIVNDRADIAAECGADGVHVGPDDVSIPSARKIVGAGRIVGASAGTIEEARRAQALGADYLGVGSVFATLTKPDAGDPLGVARLGEIVRAVTIPVVAIGGITADNAAEVVRAGAAGIAVIAAVVGQEDIAAAAGRLRERIDAARDGR
ncbi:MAG: thiamine phosphate synthase [Armatimonadota bacterium]